MKRYILFTGLFLFFALSSKAQSKPYNVVFDLTSKDTVDHKMVIRWIKEILSSDPQAKLEVVFYAQSLDMITKGKSIVAGDIESIAKNKNVAFRVCEIAMKNNKIEKDQLLTGVETVPDGIYEILLKQKDGFAYIKAAR